MIIISDLGRLAQELVKSVKSVLDYSINRYNPYSVCDAVMEDLLKIDFYPELETAQELMAIPPKEKTENHQILYEHLCQNYGKGCPTDLYQIVSPQMRRRYDFFQQQMEGVLKIEK